VEYTTIQVSQDVKKQLEEVKTDDESYNAAVKRSLEGSGVMWTEGEIRDMCREIVNEELQSIRR
jgi:hypothetical protein